MKQIKPLVFLAAIACAMPCFALNCVVGADSGFSVVAPEMPTGRIDRSACLDAQQFLQLSRNASTTAGYTPRTKDDNSQYRFNMSQNGRRMTAEEFSAWMESKGIRVAKGKPQAVPATEEKAK